MTSATSRRETLALRRSNRNRIRAKPKGRTMTNLREKLAEIIETSMDDKGTHDMKKFTLKNYGMKSEDRAADMAKRIKELVYEYSGTMPLATAIGVIDIVKLEIIAEAE